TASVASVWAKTGKLDDVESIRGFIVPADTKGFSAKDQKGKLSLRASDTSELVLQDVCLPKDAILPKSGGLKSPLSCLTQARYGIAWAAVGAELGCYDAARGYGKSCLRLGRPTGGLHAQQPRADTGAGDHGVECVQLRTRNAERGTRNSRTRHRCACLLFRVPRSDFRVCWAAHCTCSCFPRPPARNSPIRFPKTPPPCPRSSSPASDSPRCASWRAASPGGPPRSTPRTWTRAACERSRTRWSSYRA